MELFLRGTRQVLQEGQSGSLDRLPQLPAAIDPPSTARYIRAVLAGAAPVPGPIAAQVAHVVHAENLVYRSSP
jgi:hypothetical protein